MPSFSLDFTPVLELQPVEQMPHCHNSVLSLWPPLRKFLAFFSSTFQAESLAPIFWQELLVAFSVFVAV
jgi:hypothetical protein